MKIVALMDVQKKGAGYTAKDGFNLVASSDEWMSPVFAEVGPDGAVWFADWQNFEAQVQEAFGGIQADDLYPDALPARPPVARSKAGAQDAHEAIRPTDVRRLGLVLGAEGWDDVPISSAVRTVGSQA